LTTTTHSGDRILIVEDEAHLAAGIRYNLELEGYQVEVVSDGLAAFSLLTASPEAAFDLVVLDVMLPGMDGFTLADRVRSLGNLVPILMLTAKGLPEDVVQGLEAGADDYLPKPFDLPVFLARIKGLLRRRDWARGGADEATATARIGEADVDFQNFELKVRGERFRLTLLEAMLLKLLVENAGRVVSKGEILEKVWNLSPDTQTRAVDNFVMRLRRYLESDPGSPKYLHTVRGAGYRLELEG
jgi:DNA-binding response OmpR family regulator